MRLSHLFDALVCRLYLSRRPDKKCASQTNRILVITYDAIGDMVMTTPVLECLKKVFPDSEMDILCSPRNADIIRYCDDISDIFSLNLNTGKSVSEWKVITQLRNRCYEKVINLFDEVGALGLAKMASLSEKIYSLPIVYKNDQQQKILAKCRGSFFFSGKTDVKSFTEQQLSVLSLFDASIPTSYQYKTCIPEAVEKEALNRLNLDKGEGVLFNPVGSRESNSLSEQDIYSLLMALLRSYSRVMVFPYGAMGRVLAANKEIADNERLKVVRDHGILDVAITVKYADRILTTDTALVHLAIACKCPVTIIKSRSKWDRYFDPPYGDFSIVEAEVEGFLYGFKIDDVLEKLKFQKKKIMAERN